METQNGNSRRCNVCNIDIQRATIKNQLKSKRLLKKEKLFLPINFFIESNESNDTKQKMKNPTSLGEIAGDKIKKDDKQLNEKMVKKTVNPFYFTNKVLKAGYNINLEIHHFNHTSF